MSTFKLFRILTLTEKIIFEAYVKDKKTYRISKDLSGNFKNKFLKIMNGEYTHKYINKETENIDVYYINENDALSNLNKYVTDCPRFFNQTAIFIDSPVHNQFSLHFKGSDYNMSDGMNPSSAKKATDFFYQLSRIMVSSANIQTEEFATYEAASLKMDFSTSNDFPLFKETFQKLLNDFKRGTLSTQAQVGDYNLYIKILKLFKDYKFENLAELQIDIDSNQGDRINDFSRIKSIALGTYGREKRGSFVIQSVNDYYRDTSLDGLIVDTQDFSELTTWKYAKNEILSKFLYAQKGESVYLTGKTISEKSRMLESIFFERENFVIAELQKNRLIQSGFHVLNNKITLPR